jgi:hypothetical protein
MWEEKGRTPFESRRCKERPAPYWAGLSNAQRHRRHVVCQEAVGEVGLTDLYPCPNQHHLFGWTPAAFRSALSHAGFDWGGLAQTPYSLDQHQSAHAVGRQLHHKSIADGSHRLVLYPQTLRVLKIVAGEG